MSVRDILFFSFQEKCECLKKAYVELLEGMRRLREQYGDQAVDEMFASSPLLGLAELNPLAASQTGSLVIPDASGAPPVSTSENAASVPPRHRPRKGRKAKKAAKAEKDSPERAPLGFGELKQRVLSIAREFSGTQFTRHDIETRLKQEGITFSPAQVSLILSKYLRGVHVVGKDSSHGRGAARNVYQAGTRLGIKRYTKARNSSTVS
jgi:hypothetical protein